MRRLGHDADDNLISELLESALRDVTGLELPYQQIPHHVHLNIRQENFNMFKASLQESSNNSKISAKFYMGFETQLRNPLVGKYKTELDYLLKQDKYCLSDEFLEKSVTEAFKNTQEAQDLNRQVYNWKVLMNKLSNVANQIELYAPSINSKLKDKLLINNNSKPAHEFGHRDWAYLIMLKALGLLVVSVPILNVTTSYTHPIVQRIMLMIMATFLGRRGKYLYKKSSWLTCTINLAFVTVLISAFNQYLMDPILDRISTKQMIVSSKVAISKLKEVNEYLKVFVYDLETGLDNYCFWTLHQNETKANMELDKLSRKLEEFVDYQAKEPSRLSTIADKISKKWANFRNRC